MGSVSKQTAIFIGLLLVGCTYSMISPFYPDLARSKGVPLWLIGVVFSINPLAMLITSLLLGKYMVRVGRKLVLVSSFLFVSSALIVLSPIEMCDRVPFLILSIFSRVLGGIGTGCIFTSIISVFISDYPEQIQTMLGRMEASVGVGFIMGPLVGTIVYIIDLLPALIVTGGIVFLFFPFAWEMLGTFKAYEIHSININRIALVMKPVIFRQKIALTLLVTIAFMFSFGFLVTLLEIHLLSFKLNHIFIALCFALLSGTYFLISITAGSILKGIDERKLMTVGMCLLGIAYLLLGPCSYIFPNNLWVAIISLPIFSVGQSLCYRNS